MTSRFNARQIPYGILYEGGRFAADGRLVLQGRALGLTCATFVLAVLAGAGLDLLRLDNWPARQDDVSWHARVVRWLAAQHRDNPEVVSFSHVQGVAAEIGCARYRPEEIAGA